MCEYRSKRRYDVRRHENAIHGHDKFKSKHLEQEYHGKVYENTHGFDSMGSFKKCNCMLISLYYLMLSWWW